LRAGFALSDEARSTRSGLLDRPNLPVEIKLRRCGELSSTAIHAVALKGRLFSEFYEFGGRRSYTSKGTLTAFFERNLR